jgi:hypothetical protein
MKYMICFLADTRTATYHPGIMTGTMFGVISYDTMEEANNWIKNSAPPASGKYIIVPFYESDKL